MDGKEAIDLFNGKVVGTEKTARQHLQEGIKFLSKRETEEDDEMVVAKGNDKVFEIVPAGVSQAICIAVYDLGFQKTVWNGATKLQHKIILRFELDEQMTQEGEYKGKRFNVSKRYTNSLAPQARLRADLESWRGVPFTAEDLKGFDLDKLIGVNCLINILHEKKGDKTYANITSIMKLKKGMQPMIQETDTKETPEWIKKIQAEAVPQAAGKEDDIPGVSNLDESECPF